MGWVNIGLFQGWGNKELPRVGHHLASCSLLNSYALILSFSLPVRVILCMCVCVCLQATCARRDSGAGLGGVRTRLVS